MSVVELARELLEEDPVFLDTETTGLDYEDEIVDVAIIDRSGSVLLNTLIKPTISIPPAATNIHGISNEDITDAPSFPDILPRLRESLEGRTVIIYNAQYDLRMLEQTAQAHDLTISDFIEEANCAMEMYAEFHGDWNDYHQSYTWKKLEVAARRFDLDIPQDLHRALADAELTRQVIISLADSA